MFPARHTSALVKEPTQKPGHVSHDMFWDDTCKHCGNMLACAGVSDSCSRREAEWNVSLALTRRATAYVHGIIHRFKARRNPASAMLPMCATPVAIRQSEHASEAGATARCAFLSVVQMETMPAIACDSVLFCECFCTRCHRELTCNGCSGDQRMGEMKSVTKQPSLISFCVESHVYRRLSTTCHLRVDPCSTMVR